MANIEPSKKTEPENRGEREQKKIDGIVSVVDVDVIIVIVKQHQGIL